MRKLPRLSTLWGIEKMVHRIVRRSQRSDGQLAIRIHPTIFRPANHIRLLPFVVLLDDPVHSLRTVGVVEIRFLISTKVCNGQLGTILVDGCA